MPEATPNPGTKLDFSRSLYDLAAVEATAVAYAELAPIQVEAGEEQIVVHIGDNDQIPDLADHFANHVLHATISVRRRAAEGVA